MITFLLQNIWIVFVLMGGAFALAICARCQDSIKGNKTVYEIAKIPDLPGTLTGYSVLGYSLTIYITRFDYVRRFDRWYVPNEHFRTYELYAVPSGDVPERLAKACEKKVVFPAPHRRSVSQDLQVRALVNGYLDILSAQLDVGGRGRHRA